MQLIDKWLKMNLRLNDLKQRIHQLTLVTPTYLTQYQNLEKS